MIQAVYHRKFHRLSIEGHAGSGEYGHDIVCSAASILAYTLANAVLNMAECGQVRDPKVELEAGKGEVSCRTIHKYEAPVTLIFDTLCAGFEVLASEYPNNISYELRG